MIKKYLLLILFVLYLNSCCQFLESEIDGVQLRVMNNTDVDFDEIIINNTSFGFIEKYEISDYQKFDELYRYAAITLTAKDTTYFWGVLDYTGETPLEPGYYTYMLSVDYEHSMYYLKFVEGNDIPGESQPKNKNNLIDESVEYIANSGLENSNGDIVIIALKKKLQTYNPTISDVPNTHVRYLAEAYTINAIRTKLIIKTDNFGNELWRKIIPTNYNFYQDYGYDRIVQSIDDSYYIAGTGEFLTQTGCDIDGIVIKLDQTGQHLWTKIYGTDKYTQFKDIIKTDNGNFVLAGKQNDNTYILQIDEEGNQLFETQLEYSFGGESIIEIEDGFIITGDDLGGIYAEPNSGIIKIDANGNTVWDDKLYNSFYSVVETSSKDLIIVGSANYQNALLQKFNPNGELVWRKDILFDDPYIESRGYSIVESSSGYYIISGLINEDNALFSTDANGELLWSKSFEKDNMYSHTYENKVINTTDGNVLLIATKDDKVFLAKVNSEGEILFQTMIGD